MDTSSDTTVRRLSLSQRVFGVSIFALFCWLLIELACVLLWSILHSRVFSLGEFSARRNAVVEDSSNVDAAGKEINRTFLSEEALHPYVGFVLNPNVPKKSYPYPSVSEYGFSDDKAPVFKKDPSRVIVAILGGSFAQEIGVFAADTLKAQLSKIPQYAGKEIIVVKLGLGGYKQPQQALLLSYLLSIGAEFDLVINIDGFNEIALAPTENVPKGISPFFPRQWATRVQNAIDPGLFRLIGHVVVTGEGRKIQASRFSTLPLKYSPVANLLWSYLDRSAVAEVDQLNKQILDYKNKTEIDNFAGVGPKSGLSDEQVLPALAKVWFRGSKVLNALCRQNGIEYFHFLQPNQYLEGSKPLSPEERNLAVSIGHPYGRYVMSAYPLLQDLGRDLVANQVQFNDLTLVLKQHSEILYKDNCCHLRNEGYDIVVTEMAATIGRKLNAHS